MMATLNDTKLPSSKAIDKLSKLSDQEYAHRKGIRETPPSVFGKKK